MGDYINVANQEVEWIGEERRLFSEHLSKFGVPVSDAVRVEKVVFIEQDIWVLASLDHAPTI